MFITALIIPKLNLTSIFSALTTVGAISFLNTVLWDVDLFLKIPTAFTAQTITLVLINGLIFWILVKFLPGIEISGFFPAIAAPIVFSGLSMVFNKYGPMVDWGGILNQIIIFFEYLKEYFINRDSINE